MDSYEGYFVEAPILRVGEFIQYYPNSIMRDETLGTEINRWICQVLPDEDIRNNLFEYLKASFVNDNSEDNMPELEVIPTYEELIQMKYQQMKRIGEMEDKYQQKLSIIHGIFFAKFRNVAFSIYDEEYGNKLVESYSYEELKWYVDQLSKIVEYKSIDHTLLSLVIADSIKCCYVHPVTFKMVFEDLKIDQVFEFTEDEGFFESLTWDSLAFTPEDTVLEIFSQKTGNDDNRGGGCGHKKIPIDEFRYTIENVEGITIRDLTEAVYRMKGSKYDNYYELFIKIKVREQNQDRVLVEAKFDYGS